MKIFGVPTSWRGGSNGDFTRTPQVEVPCANAPLPEDRALPGGLSFQTSKIHPAHATAGPTRHGRTLFFWYLGNHGLGGDEQAGD